MSWDGTSMAAPVVSGIAAMLRSYFPQLSAPEIKAILTSSVRFPHTQSGQSTGLDEQMLNKWSNTGGIVNAATAMKLAFEWAQKYSK